MWHNAQEYPPFFVRSANIFVENAQKLHFIKENKKETVKSVSFSKSKTNFLKCPCKIFCNKFRAKCVWMNTVKKTFFNRGHKAKTVN